MRNVAWILPALLAGCGALSADDSRDESLAGVPARDDATFRAHDEAVERAVVWLEVRKPGRFDAAPGVLAGPDGLVLTTLHGLVLGDDSPALKVLVHLRDGRRYSANLAWIDPVADLAALRIEAAEGLPDGLPVADAAELGDPVWIAGWRGQVGGGWTPIRSAGRVRGVEVPIVSRLVRSLDSVVVFHEGFLWTSAPAFPGDSGLPLVDAHGRLVGIVTKRIRGGLGAIRSAGPGPAALRRAIFREQGEIAIEPATFPEFQAELVRRWEAFLAGEGTPSGPDQWRRLEEGLVRNAAAFLPMEPDEVRREDLDRARRIVTTAVRTRRLAMARREEDAPVLAEAEYTLLLAEIRRQIEQSSR